MSVFAQIETKIDTTTLNDGIIVLECPLESKTKVTHYEEGFIKTVNCTLDSASIIIHWGMMVNLPILDIEKAEVCSEFVLDDEIRIIRGFKMVGHEKKYFREDNYYKYGINLIYDNVSDNKRWHYEHFFNNVKIHKTK